jgi:hypothetical protein
MRYHVLEGLTALGLTPHEALGILKVRPRAPPSAAAPGPRGARLLHNCRQPLSRTKPSVAFPTPKVSAPLPPPPRPEPHTRPAL